MTIVFPSKLLRRARRLIELGYSDVAGEVGAEAAFHAGVSRDALMRQHYIANQDALTQALQVSTDEVIVVIDRIEREVDVMYKNAGWAVLRPQLGDVQPWSNERIARYAAALERQCEDRAAAAFERDAYGSNDEVSR